MLHGGPEIGVSSHHVIEKVASFDDAESLDPAGEVLNGEIPKSQVAAEIHVLEKGTSEVVAFENGEFDQRRRIRKTERKGNALGSRQVGEERRNGLGEGEVEKLLLLL